MKNLFKILLPLAALLLIGTAWVWPRYIIWFHARQENAVLDEKIPGEVVKVSMPLSPHLHRKITAWLYLPPGYKKLNQRYPVVYILHGAPGEVRDPFVKGRVHEAAEKLIMARKVKPFIVVCFDAHGPDGPADVTNFLNRADGKWQMEDFMVHELVPWVDKKYRTIPEARARALIGLSAGGYGAFNLGLKHPDIWSVIGSHCGFYDPADDAKNMTEILGPPGPLWTQNDPVLKARSLPIGTRLHFYMDVGQSDDLLDEFKKLNAELKARKIDHVAHIFPGGHSWEYWSAHLPDSLLFAGQRFAEMAEMAKLPVG